MITFNRALVIENVNALTDKVIKQTLENVVDELMFLSPVGQPDQWAGSVPKDYEPGKYKANWQYSVGSPESDVIEEVDGSDAMEINCATGKKLKSQIKSQKTTIGKTHYFTNNVSYASAIEYGSAIHNPQALTEPHAVAGLTIQHLPLALERAKKKVLGK